MLIRAFTVDGKSFGVVEKEKVVAKARLASAKDMSFWKTFEIWASKSAFPAFESKN